MKLHISPDLHLINTEKEAFLFFFLAIRYVSPEKGKCLLTIIGEKDIEGQSEAAMEAGHSVCYCFPFAWLDREIGIVMKWAGVCGFVTNAFR
ncbi:hypothetical protein CDAR_474631 [Caerostris darwini]|uniref:Uncharacterized protein n=1 Tax=Caerostris darwini TaxID=1538125 RepID=A0AAV4PKJ7_9ARAC|nr:hypothetical protein CDAR_474631 [Caerostris darwini]